MAQEFSMISPASSTNISPHTSQDEGAGSTSLTAAFGEENGGSVPLTYRSRFRNDSQFELARRRTELSHGALGHYSKLLKEVAVLEKEYANKLALLLEKDAVTMETLLKKDESLKREEKQNSGGIVLGAGAGNVVTGESATGSGSEGNVALPRDSAFDPAGTSLPGGGTTTATSSSPTSPAEPQLPPIDPSDPSTLLPTSLLECSHKVRALLQNRVDQSESLADQMQEDVCAILEHTLAQHSAVYNDISQDVARGNSAKQGALHNYQLLQGKYCETCLEVEKDIGVYVAKDMLRQSTGNTSGVSSGSGGSSNVASGSGSDLTDGHGHGGNSDGMMNTSSIRERSKDCLRIYELIQKTWIFEEEYRKSARSAEKAVGSTDGQRKLILDALQDMESKRMECFKDASMRFLVYQTSWIRNLQYDIESTFKKCEDCTPDIEDFIKRALQLKNLSASPQNSASLPGGSLPGGGGNRSGTNSLELAPYRADGSPKKPLFQSYDKLVARPDPPDLIENAGTGSLTLGSVRGSGGQDGHHGQHSTSKPPTNPVAALRKLVTASIFEKKDFSALRRPEFLQNLVAVAEFRENFFRFIQEELETRGMKRLEIGVGAGTSGISSETTTAGATSPGKVDSKDSKEKDSTTPTSSASSTKSTSISDTTSSTASTPQVFPAEDGALSMPPDPTLQGKSDSEIFIYVCNIALDAVSQAADVWTARAMLDLTDRIFLDPTALPPTDPNPLSPVSIEQDLSHLSEDGKVSGVPLRRALYQHQLFAQENFWHTLFLLTNAEAWQKWIVLKRIVTPAFDSEADSALFGEDPPWVMCPDILDCMLNVCVRMHLFGVQDRDVLELLKKVVKENCQHLVEGMRDLLVETVRGRFANVVVRRKGGLKV